MNTPTTVLVVDDDPRCRELLLSVLEPEGYHVLTAENGQEALAFALSHKPDVVLLDVMMPDMDGFEVCRMLRADRSLAHLPIIFTTALDDRKSHLKGIEAGADDFVSKPIDIVELRTRLRSIARLNRFRLQAEARERFEQMVAFSPNGIVITDQQGTILLANEVFKGLFSHAPAPTHLFQELNPSDIAAVRALPDHPGTSCEVRLRAPQERVIEICGAVLPWEGETAWQFCLRDITEKKHLEHQLLRTQRLDLLGQLAGSIVHDVNNILSSIAAQAALVGMDDVEPEHAKRLAAIETASFQGGGLLRQLLMFARGKEDAFTEVDPMSQLCEFHGMVQHSLGERIQVDVEVPLPVPPFMADANQIHQVLMNLCVNARDAMPRGGKIILGLERCTLSDEDGSRLCPAVPGGDYIVFRVSDNGSGIPASVRDHMFEPFFTTKAPGKGTGLGLATVQRVMQRHRGYVTVDSLEGKGTTFRCFFPLAPLPAGETGAGLQYGAGVG